MERGQRGVDVGGRDAEVALGDVAGPLELRNHRARGVDRDREADPDAAVARLPPVEICELIPITLPWALISGPPELPGLIGASVWITLSIEKLLGACDRALQRRHDAAS